MKLIAVWLEVAY